jgi:hypothetical protein
MGNNDEDDYDDSLDDEDDNDGIVNMCYLNKFIIDVV